MNGKLIRLGFCVALLNLSSAVAMAAETYTVRDISIGLAQNIAEAATMHCKQMGYLVSATVADQAGYIKSVYRADMAGPHTLDSSRRKAYTSATTKSKTSALLAASQSSPANAHLGDIDQFLLLAGGVPIVIDGVTVGAVGVGGAPSGSIDEACAEAAIKEALGKRN